MKNQGGERLPGRGSEETQRHGRLTICGDEALGKTRIVGLRLAMMTLRLMEHWRLHLGADYESSMIVLATAATTMEKFTRSAFEPELHDIRNTVPTEHLAKCNIASIAVAVGLNRETARRKVDRLVDAGILIKGADGSIRLSQDYTLSVPTSEMMQRQLETLVQTANELVRDGVLQN